jgi:transposase
MEIIYRFFVGVDWGTQVHQVCVLDQAGHLLEQRRVEHRAEAIATMIDRLLKFSGGDPASIAVGIEVPRGPLVEAFLERGLHVYAINPKQLDRFRDRHTVAGAKDDRRDAFVAADALRTDRTAFHRVRLDDPWLVQIREFSRIEEELTGEMTRLSNRLRDLLLRFYPQMLRLCPAADQPWLWALLKLAPTPSKGQRLRRSSVEKVLSKHRTRKWTADQIRTELKTPALTVAPGVVDAAAAHLMLLLPRIELLARQRKDCSRALETLLAQDPRQANQKGEHRDTEILLSLPGVGRVVAATMLAEASQPLAQRNYHALRTLAGVAPVTRQSGKRSTVQMRYGCNQRLRNALYHWARVSAQCDPSAKQRYQNLRQRGHSHPRALRSLADSHLRRLVAMLRSNTLYDHTRTPKSAAA